jgi:hypothetical protein
MFDNSFSSHYISVPRLIQDSQRLPPRFLCIVRKPLLSSINLRCLASSLANSNSTLLKRDCQEKSDGFNRQQEGTFQKKC